MDDHDPNATTEHDATGEGMPEAISDAPSTTEGNEAQAPTIDA